MEDVEFSDEFCRFVQLALPSVDVAELMLLLARHPERAWSAAEARAGLPRDVNLTEAEVIKHLDTFVSRGLAAPTPEKQYRYGAAPVLDLSVRTLMRAYQERPVTLFRLIYALRDAKLQSFADAFRIRGK